MKVKTNAMRQLDARKLKYQMYEYQTDGSLSGIDVANLLKQDPKRVFKTLVTVGKSKQHYVFMIPVAAELDLKKVAKIVHEKSIEMVKSKDLLKLTGYIHGGCSPIGMKKAFPTALHTSALDFPTIIFSAGKIGYQIETSIDSLKQLVSLTVGDLIKN